MAGLPFIAVLIGFVISIASSPPPPPCASPALPPSRADLLTASPSHSRSRSASPASTRTRPPARPTARPRPSSASCSASSAPASCQSRSSGSAGPRRASTGWHPSRAASSSRSASSGSRRACLRAFRPPSLWPFGRPPASKPADLRSCRPRRHSYFADGARASTVSARRYQRADATASLPSPPTVYGPSMMGSVLAGSNFMRFGFGAITPLFALQMFVKLGAGWACTLLGLLCVVFFPAPIIFFVRPPFPPRPVGLDPDRAEPATQTGVRRPDPSTEQVHPADAVGRRRPGEGVADAVSVRRPDPGALAPGLADRGRLADVRRGASDGQCCRRRRRRRDEPPLEQARAEPPAVGRPRGGRAWPAGLTLRRAPSSPPPPVDPL